MGKRARVILDVVVDQAVSDSEAQEIMEKTFKNIREPYASDRFKVTEVTYEEFVEKEETLAPKSLFVFNLVFADKANVGRFFQNLSPLVTKEQVRFKTDFVSQAEFNLHYKIQSGYTQAEFTTAVNSAASGIATVT